MTSKRVVLHFPKTLVDEPIISETVRTYDLDFIILRASITPDNEGLMVIGFTGEEKKVDAAIRSLKQRGVIVQPLSKGVVRNEERCTECGACLTICPTRALVIDLESRHVSFDSDKCIACELCVPVCPPRAMQLTF
ncbi:MAG: NIL domain-containing protein [Armatimonadota bacterium]